VSSAPSSAPAPSFPPPARPAAPIPSAEADLRTIPRASFELPSRWADEKPASAWLDEATAKALEERAEWLEQEARALTDDVARARQLLACSELRVTLGDRTHAHTLAVEAQRLAPSLALASRQARALMSWPPDPEDTLEALEAEIETAPAGGARVHSILLAADALRATGDEDGAARRLEEAARAAVTDVRAIVARAARALAQGDATSPSLRIPGGAALAPVADAVEVVLRLRGTGATAQERATADGPRQLTPSDHLRSAREALARGDVGSAGNALAELTVVPELASGARWLAAAFGAASNSSRERTVEWLLELVEHGDQDAQRALITRSLELGDVDFLQAAVSGPIPLTSAERLTLAVLTGIPLAADDPRIDATAATPGMHPLAAAICASSAAPGEARNERAAGSAASQAQLRLGRRLAASAKTDVLESALAALSEETATTRGIRLELDAREGRAAEVSRAVESWGQARSTPSEQTFAAVASALVAERAGATARAVEAFKTAHELDPTFESAIRALASLETLDFVAEMNGLADAWGDGLRAALTRIEAVSQSGGTLPEPTEVHLLETAHRASPGLPIAAFLAERIARRSGDVDEVLRWVRERRSGSNDPIEGALDSVREALLIADREPVTSAERLREAQAVRPADVALRELFERMATHPPDDRAAWREQRAAEARGDARVLLSLEAAHDYERIGDDEGAFRAATNAAAAADVALTRIARERAELRTGRVARLADELMEAAKASPDADGRREAYERLAHLDATSRGDAASALLWHRSILEELPESKPSLRHVEQHLIGEGRTDELEPIAASIARALRGTGPGEFTAHAELAASLRIHAGADVEAVREMVDLAVSEAEPTVAALRLSQAQARARADDATFLETTKRLVDRLSRSSDTAALLVRAGEAALRVERLDEARALLQRASVEDSGDVVAWWLLAEVRRRAGDARGAAEACEALARSSGVRHHQLLAWYDAGRLWLDEVHDEQRAIVALEAAASIDVAHADIFDRLSRGYASRKMQSELAELLERRLERVNDPQERLEIEVRRGRVLLDTGEIVGARRAFQAALSQRPDDPGALSAFADLCTSQGDWDAAEQALVRLARLLPTAEEQRLVYARLGDLYSHRLLNLSRAEVALKEVLKRGPDDVDTARKLVEIYKRQNDPARAVELQQDLVTRAQTPDEKRERVLELAAIHERLSRDLRRAERTLETARRESPNDVPLLRALADFYTRHHQTPAVNILLDRASADARRTLAAGRISTAPFEVVAAVFELRGNPEGGAATRAMLRAVEGHGTSAEERPPTRPSAEERPPTRPSAEERPPTRPSAEAPAPSEKAFDTQLDDALAPEVLSAAIRSLLLRTGGALDAAAPVDLRELQAAPVPPHVPAARAIRRLSSSLGLSGLDVLSSPKLSGNCLPVRTPLALIFAENVLENDRASLFLGLRALKLLGAGAAALGRGGPAEVAILVSAWLKCLNPAWEPQGVPAAAVALAAAKVQAALPRTLEPDIGTLALETAATLEGRLGSTAFSALAWADRVALLASADPAGALDGVAMSGSLVGGAPAEERERSAWIARTPEARDLVAFSVTEAFAQVWSRCHGRV
jgi:tetratricopeptide (TPR) repeat protein